MKIVLVWLELTFKLIRHKYSVLFNIVARHIHYDLYAFTHYFQDNLAYFVTIAKVLQNWSQISHHHQFDQMDSCNQNYFEL
jgi:hypothetical protein